MLCTLTVAVAALLVVLVAAAAAETDIGADAVKGANPIEAINDRAMTGIVALDILIHFPFLSLLIVLLL
ncbi:hypothetical protein D3C78_1684220 [compost metagenome]